jgi:Type IV secretion-system coupling protein DNA-binding domain
VVDELGALNQLRPLSRLLSEARKFGGTAITRSDTQQGLIGGSVSKSEQIREVHTVMPGELQSLPPLEGYLTISDGTPAARVTIEAQGYGKGGRRFVAITKKAVPPITSSYTKSAN